MRLKLGLETSVPSLHMGFTGAPGTGKTTVALRMGQILQRMGYCRTGHVVVATRDDLVGQYVGHTAPKTKEMVKKAMGGILLVDEAYYLYNAANDRDYGQESIEILLNVMENNKEDIIVVLAGYKDRMDSFYSFIPVRMHTCRHAGPGLAWARCAAALSLCSKSRGRAFLARVPPALASVAAVVLSASDCLASTCTFSPVNLLVPRRL